jgi:N6-L-threonylcarbamoyladenine synthase
LNTWQKLQAECEGQAEKLEQGQADVARAFEEAVVDTLSLKCRRALKQVHCKRLVIAGGVGANQHLRQQLKAMVKKEGGDLYYPRIEFCTDNGAMIAYVGCLRLMAGESKELSIDARARWPMDELSSIQV